MGNAKSKDHDKLWRKKQEYYERIASEVENPGDSAEFACMRKASSVNRLIRSEQSHSSQSSDQTHKSRQSQSRPRIASGNGG